MASWTRNIIAGQIPATRGIFRRWQRIKSRSSCRGVESAVCEVMCTTLRYLHVPLTVPYFRSEPGTLESRPRSAKPLHLRASKLQC